MTEGSGLKELFESCPLDKNFYFPSTALLTLVVAYNRPELASKEFLRIVSVDTILFFAGKLFFNASL
jgi:hypothetical protein